MRDNIFSTRQTHRYLSNLGLTTEIFLFSPNFLEEKRKSQRMSLKNNNEEKKNASKKQK